MKIVVVGSRGPVVDAASAAFSARDGVDLGRVKSLEQAVEICDGEKEAVVLFPALEKVSEKTFAPITGSSAKVVVLAPANPAIRAQAFAVGAYDVVFPPHDGERMEAAIERALGRPLRKWRRCAAPIPVDVLLTNGSKVEGRVLNLSVGGAQILLREAFRPEGVVRVALRLPSPYQSVTLFARPIAFERPPEGPGVVLRAQFVGLSVDEEEVLQLFVESLESSLEEFAGQLRALQKLDLRRLRGGYERGVRLPTLAGCEQRWLAAAPGSPESELAVIALARCRAIMITTLFQSFFESGEEAPPGIPPFRQWRGELKMSGDMLRQEISRRIMAADLAGAKELKDLEARLTNAAEQLDRIAERVTGQKREEKKIGAIRDQVVRTQEEVDQEVMDDAAEVAASTANAPVELERTFLARPDVRRWIGIIVPTLVFAVVVLETRWERHRAFPPAAVVADSPMFKARNVNVRTFYQNVHTLHWIAIVDSTWWKGDDAERWRVTRDIAERQRIPEGDVLEVRSYQGDVQAMWVAGKTPPDPPPVPFPKTGDAGSDASSKPPS